MSPEKIIVQATIATNRQKVWEYYTQPEHITKWNFADSSWYCPFASNDLMIGGKYTARMEAKDGSFGFDFEAVYTNIEIGELIIYEFGGRFAEIKFLDSNGATEVIINFDPETENPLELQQNGWQSILNNFKNYTEAN